MLMVRDLRVCVQLVEEARAQTARMFDNKCAPLASAPVGSCLTRCGRFAV